MELLLNDTKYYKKISTNPLLYEQKNTDKLHKELYKYNIFKDKKPQNTFKKTNISKCYGLIKIHKKDYPLRPIISAVNFPTYSLSKFFAKFLQSNLKNPPSHINNSFELQNKLSCIKIADDYEIISLEVVSFFTNVHEDLIYEAIGKR